MLYGMSLLYGASGSLELTVISAALKTASMKPIALIAVLCFFVGLGFKISMAPFHMWRRMFTKARRPRSRRF